MENALPKIKSTVSAAPIGAVVGAVGGYLLARSLNFHKTITVVPFIVVGTILTAAIAHRVSTK